MASQIADQWEAGEAMPSSGVMIRGARSLTPKFGCKHTTTITAKPHPKSACLLPRSLGGIPQELRHVKRVMHRPKPQDVGPARCGAYDDDSKPKISEKANQLRT